MPPVLETVGLVKRFGGITAASDVSLKIEKGARHALIGPNGAGKTTVINLLTGVLRPTAGRILLDGQDITNVEAYERVHLGIARTFQINQLFADLTPIETLGLAVSERMGTGRQWWRLVGRKTDIVEEIVGLIEQFHLADVMYHRTAILPYGKQRLLGIVLSDISLSIAEGQSIALLGRNGMGKTTLVNSIVGVTRYLGGTIALDGRNIARLRPDQRAHAGVGWVPQERNIFKSLTVHENLTAVAQRGPWTAQRIYDLFPRLSERRRNLGNQLSGGEQQMLAVGRALILNPRLMLLDEPLEGLPPLLVEELLLALRGIIRDEGMSAILVGQNAQEVLGVTDRAAIIERGAVVYDGASADLAADRAVLESYLCVTAVRSRRTARHC